jgi:hypothetical protein
MKLTRERLKQIIKEELEEISRERSREINVGLGEPSPRYVQKKTVGKKDPTLGMKLISLGSQMKDAELINLGNFIFSGMEQYRDSINTEQLLNKIKDEELKQQIEMFLL